MGPIPITIVTGFLGSGKTTLILNLIPQLPKDYKLALLKNEFGDVAIDTQLASSASISNIRELLNGCICCNLVGQLGPALSALSTSTPSLNRIIIETSGSAFPATLAIEINRLGRETGEYVLDGVISVIDVENWQGYEDTSYTAKMQARYTDLIVLNKWEMAGEWRVEECRDRIGDLEMDVPMAVVRSERGKVDAGVLLGLDGRMAREIMLGPLNTASEGHATHRHNGQDHDHGRVENHQQEVEVLSITLSSSSFAPDGLAKGKQGINLELLDKFLRAAPKDEIYRIKAILSASSAPNSSSEDGITTPSATKSSETSGEYILNWAFGRWTFTPLKPDWEESGKEHRPLSGEKDGVTSVDGHDGVERPVLKMTVVLARREADVWKRKIEAAGYIEMEGGKGLGRLEIKRLL